MNTEEIQIKIKELQEEYNSLKKGKQLNIVLSFNELCFFRIYTDYNTKLKPTKIVLNEQNLNSYDQQEVDWDEGVTSQYEWQVKNHREEFQARVDKFNKECKTIAKELGKGLSTFLKEDIIVD